VVQDYMEAAVRLYRLSAAQGNAVAQSNLGRRYAEGECVARDDVEAARLYGLLAAQGYAVAQYNLGVLCYKGEGVAQSFVETARLWRLAAAQGVDAAARGLNMLASERAYVSACCIMHGLRRHAQA
jgi:hypothetical protein